MMWNDLVTTALVGTTRRPLKLDAVPEPFRDLAAQLAGQDTERALLALAGAMTLHQRAGEAPVVDTSPLLTPCDLDDLPPCSPRAGLYLQQILAQRQHMLHLPEWLTAAARAGQRITEEYLPCFLTAFERRENLPDHFYDVLGKRGRWLAQQNPAWAYAIVPPSDANWDLYSLPARLHFLRQLRASDPVHARELVESVWNQEKAETRAALTQTLEVSLSLEDESFFETILDNRSSEVRSVAVGMLAKMTGSAYQQRMIKRAQPLIQIVRKRQMLNQKLAIVLKLPESSDEDMIRDGIPAKPPKSSNMGERAFWLTRIAAALPSSYWLSGDWSARELVQSASDNDTWNQLLLAILAQIAEREGQHDLGDALLEVEIDGENELAALRAARPAAREAYVLAVLQPSSIKDDEAFKRLNALCMVGHHWSVSLTRAFLAMAYKRSEASTESAMAYARALPIYLMRMSPACADDLRSIEPDDRRKNPVWAHAVKQAISTLEFRRNMHKEFSR